MEVPQTKFVLGQAGQKDCSRAFGTQIAALPNAAYEQKRDNFTSLQIGPGMLWEE